jgi:hypothetical protein
MTVLLLTVEHMGKDAMFKHVRSASTYEFGQEDGVDVSDGLMLIA